MKKNTVTIDLSLLDIDSLIEVKGVLDIQANTKMCPHECEKIDDIINTIDDYISSS